VYVCTGDVCVLVKPPTKSSKSATSTGRKVDQSKATAGLKGEAKYWKMIQQTGYTSGKLKPLQGYSKTELQELKRFVDKKYEALRKKIEPYWLGKKKPELELSDDSFHYWLYGKIGSGKTQYTHLLEKPQTYIPKYEDDVDGESFGALIDEMAE
jgi:hypothetical protein